MAETPDIYERLRKANEALSKTPMVHVPNKQGLFVSYGHVREFHAATTAMIETQAAHITRLTSALRWLVEANIKRGPFDEPLGSSEQTPEMNEARATLEALRNGGSNA